MLGACSTVYIGPRIVLSRPAREAMFHPAHEVFTPKILRLTI